MELSKDLVGRLVAMQFGRPLMMFEYAAHVKKEDADAIEQLLGQPIIVHGPGGKNDPEGGRVSALDFVMGATIEEVGKDWLRFSMLDIRKDDARTGNRLEHTIPTGLIMQIVEIVGFEVETPSVVSKVRTDSKIVL